MAAEPEVAPEAVLELTADASQLGEPPAAEPEQAGAPCTGKRKRRASVRLTDQGHS